MTNIKTFTQWLIYAGLIDQFVYDSLEGKPLDTYSEQFEAAMRAAL